MAPKAEKHKWTIEEFLNSARDHIGSFLDHAKAEDLIDLFTCGALVYMSQAPSNTNEFKLLHGTSTALAYRELTKQNTSESQALMAKGWIAGEIANYAIWVGLNDKKSINTILAGLSPFLALITNEEVKKKVTEGINSFITVLKESENLTPEQQVYTISAQPQYPE